MASEGNYDALRECLNDTGELHKRFLDCLESVMRTKKRVHIAEVSAAVAREIGKRNGKLASEAMWKVAPKTRIEILDARSS